MIRRLIRMRDYLRQKRLDISLSIRSTIKNTYNNTKQYIFNNPAYILIQFTLLISLLTFSVNNLLILTIASSIFYITIDFHIWENIILMIIKKL